jgi:threonyl-tRNA synthetase
MEEHVNPKLYRIRHSLAHVMAQAVKAEFPQAKLGFGPPTETGFYYDFDFGGTPFRPEDMPRVEKKMRQILQKKAPFERTECGGDEAVARLSAVMGSEPYKEENIRNLRERGVHTFSFYQHDNFIDLCEGPHVGHCGELLSAGFKLDRIAGAYWLGDEKRPMLTRIYALAYEKPAELDDFVKRRAAAEEFDHRKLGKELDIYHIDDTVGKGLILWLPNGTIIRDEIENLAKEKEFQYGYHRVATPHITKSDLFYKSQHLPAYKDSMFPPLVAGEGDAKEEYYLRPMNCPFHHMIYGARMRSYRELPYRLAEYGQVYRFEQSGELGGLIRVRGMAMNDAHIYCRVDQLGNEIHRTMQLYKELYSVFKLKDYTFRLSVRGSGNRDKFKGSDEMWEKGEAFLEQALKDMGLPYYKGEGEAAFYGPKIDIQFKNLMGRSETVSTIQADFLAPINFDMKYINESNQEERPVVIHRAPLSTHERFLSFLLEYYGGAFPVWCAPVQVALIPVKDDCLPYARELAERLRRDFFRVEVDDSDASFNKKIRNNTVRKIPIMGVIGMKEVEERTLTVRRYGIPQQEVLPLESFVKMLTEERATRANPREPMGSII